MKKNGDFGTSFRAGGEETVACLWIGLQAEKSH